MTFFLFTLLLVHSNLISLICYLFFKLHPFCVLSAFLLTVLYVWNELLPATHPFSLFTHLLQILLKSQFLTEVFWSSSLKVPPLSQSLYILSLTYFFSLTISITMWTTHVSYPLPQQCCLTNNYKVSVAYDNEYLFSLTSLWVAWMVLLISTEISYFGKAHLPSGSYCWFARGRLGSGWPLTLFSWERQSSERKEKCTRLLQAKV